MAGFKVTKSAVKNVSKFFFFFQATKFSADFVDERIEAFLKLGRKDPVEYIDGWEIAKKHVENLLINYNK